MNNDLISRSALKRKFRNVNEGMFQLSRVYELIDNAPTVEGEIEILTKEAYSDLCLRASRERPQGEWIKYISNIECSNCGEKFYCEEDENCQDYEPCNDFLLNFCPNCGAKMTKEASDE
jgi:hypothetical protein